MLNDKNNTITLPPRCESIHYISTKLIEDLVVIPQELCAGVYMAGAIVSPSHCQVPIKILNTRDREVH